MKERGSGGGGGFATFFAIEFGFAAALTIVFFGGDFLAATDFFGAIFFGTD